MDTERIYSCFYGTIFVTKFSHTCKHNGCLDVIVCKWPCIKYNTYKKHTQVGLNLCYQNFENKCILCHIQSPHQEFFPHDNPLNSTFFNLESFEVRNNHFLYQEINLLYIKAKRRETLLFSSLLSFWFQYQISFKHHLE